MAHSDELENLVDQRWFERRQRRGYNDGSEEFALANGVIAALRHNKAFVPEKIEGLGIQELVEKMERHIDKNIKDRFANFEDDERWLVQLCKANPHLPLCHEVLCFDGNLHVQSLLLMIVYD